MENPENTSYLYFPLASETGLKSAVTPNLGGDAKLNQDSFLLGDPLTVPAEGLTVSDVPLEGDVRATYRFTDLYQQSWWTPSIP